MKILGINISHDFSVCVFENNKILDYFYESRFNLNKKFRPVDTDFFIFSIFKKINFKPDLVIYSSYGRKNNYSEINSKNYKITDDDIIKQIQKQLDNPPHYFNKHNHHIYHTCSSFHFSNFDEAMSIVIDGGGAYTLPNNYREIQSIFYIDKNKILKLFQHLSNIRDIFIPNIINTEYSNQVFSTFLNGTEYVLSSLQLGGLDFLKACDKTGLKNEPGKLMGLSSYAYSNLKFDLNYDYVNIAKDVQEKSFKETCQLIEKAYEYKRIKNFILSGGYFLNCSNNFKYVKKYPELNFFVDPDPSDGGTALGACVYNDYR
jgi:predicted NodU family carbamoyl transferase